MSTLKLHSVHIYVFSSLGFSVVFFSLVLFFIILFYFHQFRIQTRAIQTSQPSLLFFFLQSFRVRTMYLNTYRQIYSLQCIGLVQSSLPEIIAMLVQSTAVTMSRWLEKILFMILKKNLLIYFCILKLLLKKIKQITKRIFHALLLYRITQNKSITTNSMQTQTKNITQQGKILAPHYYAT